MGRAHKRWGTPWIAILIMGVVDAILVKGSFATLIVIDVFLLMFSYIPIFIAGHRAARARTQHAAAVPHTDPHVAARAWVCLPIAIAVYALFTNGSDYLVGGLVGVVSGPIAYLHRQALLPRHGRRCPRGLGRHGGGSSRSAARALRDVAHAVDRAGGRRRRGGHRAWPSTSTARHPWAVGGVWKVAGVAVSPQRLLAAMGLLMIVGGLVVRRSRASAASLVAAAVVIALCLIYRHADFRTTNVWVWSAPIVLAVLAAVFAGLALKAEIEPVGRPPVAVPLAPPVDELGEPLVVGAPPSV